jgi:glutamine amidotransferase
MITIIDYGAGNIGSIVNMIRKVGSESKVSSNKEEILSAEKLILPGVGSFDYGMQKLIDSDLIDVINKKVIHDKTPILGICLGVQLMTRKSEEGNLEGLGWFDAETVKFTLNPNERLKIPHMGWNEVTCENGSKLFNDMYEYPRFYFVHSFHLKSNKVNEALVNSVYGYKFAAGLEKENIVGVQFHPEKSHKYGMKILENFIKYY